MKKTKSIQVLMAVMIMAGLAGCSENTPQAPQWEQITLAVQSDVEYSNPYTDVDMYAVFTHPAYGKIRRPAFWDGGNTWKVRFASPVAEGSWRWETFCSNTSDKGLHGITGSLNAAAYSGNNPLVRHGLLRMSEGHRNVVHADGTSFFLVGDTPWALPWRATWEDAAEYARDRQQKGFNAALLMTFCPDRHAEGPDARATEGGFARAFSDIREGHINQMIVPYFQYMDSLITILIDHGIVPVYQPIFQGYGWKGLQVLGWDMQPEEYERYMRYLIARYGARPAIWLVCGDSDCREPGIVEAGMATQLWDDYQQPTGQHYSPFDDVTPNWWDRDYEYIPHFNKVNHDAKWLDFQWCQTGHGGEHLFQKVEAMYDNLPTKGTANGEPTYEGIRDPANASGWWQGHEAWGNMMYGGTMGVVYGAGGLWNWKISAGEQGWPAWANSLVSWREAMALTGSTYVGYVGKAMEGLDVSDIERRPAPGGKGYLLVKPGKTLISYLPDGGRVFVEDMPAGTPFQWFKPKTGEFIQSGVIAEDITLLFSPDSEPMVLLVGHRK